MRLLTLAWVGLLCTCLAAAEEAPPPDFSGSWELNAERSDDPRERVEEAMRGIVSSPRSGAGRGRPPSGADGSGDGRQAVKREVMAMTSGPRVITVRHVDPKLVIESALPDQPFHEIVYTDGREFALRGAGGEEPRARGGWRRGGRLVIEYSSPSGRSVVETWELVAEGSRVLVATEIAAKRPLPAIRIERVYDRVEIIPWAVPD